MNLYRNLVELPADFGPSVATIGNFDGVHLGHQGVISKVIARARTLGLTSLAITFDPHPARVLRPESPQPLITPTDAKLALLAATGIENIVLLPFTEAFSKMDARSIATDILQRALRVKELHEGENFRFGYQAQAGIDSLEALGKELGFAVHIYSPRIVRGQPVSSTRIRQLIAAGEVGQVRVLLGKPFTVSSTPASGRGYGTRYTVPTINLSFYPELLPAHGVYITSLAISNRAAQETFDAVTNVGNRPTFGSDSFTVESHLLNFHPIELTEQTELELTFLKRLRAEQHWPSPEALREQIGSDVAQARRYFNLCRRVAGEFRRACPQPASQD